VPINTAFDGLEFDSLDFPYNLYQKELSEEPHFVAGSNAVVTLGGKVVKRGGTIQLLGGNTAANQVTGRIERLWAYENLAGVTYLVASVSVSGNYSLYYTVNSNANWVQFTNTRGCNNATAPHEATFSRGIMYIKSYTTSDSEKLGSITFDTNSGSPVFSYWGVLGPTTPAAIVGAVDRINMAAGLTASGTALTVATAAGTAGFPSPNFFIQIDYETIKVTSTGAGTNWTIVRAQNGTLAAAHSNTSLITWLNWTASTHPVTVNFGWLYSYAWQDLNGQISSRAPVETNPDNLPSSTGPFINLRPKITVQGKSDTTNYPKIVIFRTTDGGGTFYTLETITNTGSGAITYEDKSLVSGTTLTDPIPDNVIDGNIIGPSLTSNSPPPSVTSPKVIGTDQPQQFTPLTTFQGRIWYAIQNILFYSGNEEISTGIPEESFPSGNFGNFFRFTEPIVNVISTTYSLYVFTPKKVYGLTGTTRDTFSVRLLLGYVGGAIVNAFSNSFLTAKAATVYRDSVVWLTDDFRVAIIQGKLSSLQSDYFNIISDPIGKDLITSVNTYGANIDWDIKYWTSQEKEYIIVSCSNRAGNHPERDRQWIYDVKKSALTKQDFWMVPWTSNCSCLMTQTRVSNGGLQDRQLVFSTFDGTNSLLSYWDSTGATSTDLKSDGTSSDFSFSVRSNLISQPPGNHMNALRRPAMTTTVDHIIVDRTTFQGDSDPIVKYYTDDIWTVPKLTPVTQLPERRVQSLGYTTHIFPVNEACRRFGWEISKDASAERFELQNLAIVFNSDAGA